MRYSTLLLFAALFITPPALGQELSAGDLDRRRKALSDLLDEHWEYTLRTQPEFASLLGDKRYNDQLTDPSEKAVLARLEDAKKFLKRFVAIDPAGFSEQERLNRELMLRDLRNEVEDARFRHWLMPVNQMGGIHLFAAQFPSMLSFTAAKDYDDLIARMKKYPAVFDGVMANMRKGMAARLMPPKFLLVKVAEQAEEIARQKAEDSPFAAPLKNFPDAMAAAERERIRGEFLEAIRAHMLSSYAKFAAFVRNEYAPKGRTTDGIWSFPDAAARYANAAQRSTTTDLTPQEIHEIGLREVARIEADGLAVARKLGFADIESFEKAIESNPDLRPKSREEIVEIYKRHTDQMYRKLPELFGRLPKAPVEIVKVEEFREQAAAGANYDSPAPDGSRPGRVYVNTYEPQKRKTISFESTAYHEGVPGHHMQIAIAQELPDIPPFRRFGGYTAYVEGWALYSERLGKEVGFYQNPYSDYGRLQDEMLRAIRLVVDTGLHHKKWTREQVVQYFRDHSSIDEVDLQAETDRYIVWPGQALAYKIGQMKILELRERAQRELGARFDIRAFHDEILGAGALPLGTLEERINRWIAARRAGTS
jgi:uncharacterized protein (DUF885 family)